jgi:hypothetical protein
MESLMGTPLSILWLLAAAVQAMLTLMVALLAVVVGQAGIKPLQVAWPQVVLDTQLLLAAEARGGQANREPAAH